MESFKVLVLYFLLLSFIPRFNSLDSISSGQSIKDNQTLISANETFEAGFTSIGNSNRLYFGIWYLNISLRTVVWVANRESPIGNSSGVLNITNGGNLLILDGTGSTIWSSNSSIAAGNPVLQLLDSGNLILKDENNSDKIFWQSFDHPGDTFLAGMKLKSNLKNGDHISLTSWTNADDPTPGAYSSYIDIHGYPQQIITRGGTLLYRVGSWNGLLFSGVPWETLSKSFNFSFVLTEQDVYYEYQLLDTTIVTRYTLNLNGLIQRFIWLDRTETWELFSVGPGDQCDNYAYCGENSNCNINSSPNCQCLKGFTPKSPKEWSTSNWTDGCVRSVNLDCDNRDGFVKYTEVKLPDTSSSWFDRSLNLQQCENLCLRNCSCTAYANLDVRDGGSGCLLWFGDIVDIKTKPSEGQDIYIRVAHSELDETKNSVSLNKKQLAGILVACILFIICLTALGFALYLRRKKRQKPVRLGKNNMIDCENHTESKEKEHIDIPMFGLSTIAIATNDFSESSKLGEGGFGPVYKGILENGQEIAVKRLSTNSKQGPEEFKNEVVLIANLQHRNLVKLLGCCIENDERLLIYEFMPNRSLDNFIFDQARSSILHWTQRFRIINGIARGLLYLHEDSRLKIIHRDLKISNILLDKNMNPKISDFGLARIFDADQDKAETKRVVGTYGYMPPEYAVRGQFSIKSDVFSFGVIILEIVSGKRNREFFDPYNDLDLLGHAWRLWCEDKPLEMIDESIGDTVIPAEILRCIHIGLLCVQNRPEDRPDMSSVVLMLNGEKPLPKPKQPAFYSQEDSSSIKYELWSTCEMSVSLVDSR